MSLLKDQNHFNLFNLPSIFHIDKPLLKKNYYDRVSNVYAGAYNRNEEKSKNEFLKLREGYETLEDDLKRAVYLNSLKKTINSEEKKPLLKNTDFQEFLDIEDDGNLKMLKEKIKECRENYSNPYYIERWKYLDGIERRS